jgi:flagellar basal body-associated protein FliL
MDRQSGKKNGRLLWLWVILAFAVLIAAWSTLIVIAIRNQPEAIEIQRP